MVDSAVYTANNPLKYVDKEGEWLDTVVDIAAITYSSYKLGQAIVNGGDVKREAGNLALDVGGVFIPGVAGLGTLRRAANVAEGVKDGGKVINGTINIGKDRLQHVKDGHTLGGKYFVDGKNSYFNEGEDIVQLIKQGTQQVAIRNERGAYERTYDIGRNVGFDKNTGAQTSSMTVVTNKAGDLITAFPGSPTYKQKK